MRAPCRPSAVAAACVLLAAWPFAGCDGSETAPRGSLAVTGFAITTPGSPEVDPARVCGRPTRTSGLLTAVPNPYRGTSAYEEEPDDRRLRFINLPERVRIELVRAYWHTVGPRPALDFAAGGLVRVYGSEGRTVRVLEKDSPSRSFDWDLRDERGDLVPSGFYRAYVTVPSAFADAGGLAGRRGFEDLYIVQREDVGVWRDPTGCL